jgi:ribonuclease P protein component
LQRLKTRNQFQAVLAGGTIARTAHFALHRAALDAPVIKQNTFEPSKAPQLALFVVRDVWMGAMVPKRWAKRAVTRNAIKRQIYSVSTDFESKLPVAGHVVRLRAGFDRQQFISATSDALKAAVRQELQQLFARAVARPASPTIQGGSP